jgi:ceramide glucosyltransferase
MLYTILVAICTAFTALSIIAVARIARRPRSDAPEAVPPRPLPPVSVLKPLCGVDDSLAANLESFFRLDYPVFELVFGIEGSEDPAAALVREMSARFPHVACRLVIHAGGRAINPKVSNLRAMLSSVRHDVLVISDSNVSVPPSYLRVLVNELIQPKVGLVTSLFAGVGEQTLGASLENLHLNGLIAGSVATSQELAGRAIAVGKSMAFRRSTFERLGGFESIASVLAEDYVMGRMFREAGLEVRIAPQIIQTVCVHTPVRAFLRRHQRWSLMRSRLQPLLYPLEPLSSPLAIALLAPLFGVSLGWSLLWALALVMLRDGAQWWVMRGRQGLLRVLPLVPLKEVLVLGIWMAAPFFKYVSWRGNRVRLSSGTRLYATSVR